MIEPWQSDELLLADIAQTRQHRQGVSAWWLGQSGYLIHYDGVCIAVDPYLSDSLTQKYAHTDKPHERVSRRVVDPAALQMVSLITSSHNHTDHLDAETVWAIAGTNPSLQLVCSAANTAFAEERMQGRVAVVGLTADQAWQHGPFRLHVIPAAHNQRESDGAGHDRYIGLMIEVGGVCLYHSGDTLWCDAALDRLRPWQIDCALLPINGNVPERRVAGNLDGAEAVAFAQAMGARLVVPCHYDLFAFNTVSPQLFVDTAMHQQQAHRVLQIGERIDWK